MIMKHEYCKNIPVIMMSSQDSASVVFKCMLRGAADFLSKPIRKNELKNLWQHVWRRQSSKGDKHAEEDETHPQIKTDSTSENNATSSHSINDVAIVPKLIESSEKGSDNLRSCTKLDTEAEHPIINVAQHQMHTKSWKSILADNKGPSKGDRNVKSVSVLPVTNGAHEDKSGILSAQVALYDHAIGSIEIEEKSVYRNNPCDNSGKMIEPCKEAPDLIATVENQPKFNQWQTGPSFTGGGEDAESPVSAKFDDICTSTSLPLLELSLRSSLPQGCEKCENEEKGTLNHSSASAFSWYNNKSGRRNILPSGNSSTKLRESTDNCQLYMLNQVVDEVMGSSPVGFIPIPCHLGGFDGFSSGYGALVQPLLCGQAGSPLWTMHSARQQDGVNYNLSTQSGPEAHGYEQTKWVHDQTASKIDKPVLNENVNTIKKVISGVSGDDNLCNGSKTFLRSSGCDSHGSNVNSTVPAAAVDGKTDERHCANNVVGVVDWRKSCQREAALTKFRLKRKDRCFDKKVRYQSRKKLAEQRQRVKGQFVRQVQCDS